MNESFWGCGSCRSREWLPDEPPGKSCMAVLHMFHGRQFSIKSKQTNKVRWWKVIMGPTSEYSTWNLENSICLECAFSLCLNFWRIWLVWFIYFQSDICKTFSYWNKVCLYGFLHVLRLNTILWIPATTRMLRSGKHSNRIHYFMVPEPYHRKTSYLSR